MEKNIIDYNDKKTNVTENKKRKQGNVIVERGSMILVYPNTVEAAPYVFDIEDRPLVEKYTICENKNGYALAHDKIRGEKIYLHRAVMGVLDKPSDHYIDHIDGNKKNNRKSNLRICHPEDASNAGNRNKKFVGHEKVMKFRQPNDTFILNISNGIYQDVEFEYAKFGDLLDDEDILWNHGLDKGILMLIERNEQAALDILSSNPKKTKEYVLAENELNKLKWLREFLVVSYYNASQFSKQIKLPKGGIVFVDNKLFINIGGSYSSKEMKENNIQPLIVFEPNQQKIKQVGKHFTKPDGNSIY